MPRYSLVSLVSIALVLLAACSVTPPPAPTATASAPLETATPFETISPAAATVAPSAAPSSTALPAAATASTASSTAAVTVTVLSGQSPTVSLTLTLTSSATGAALTETPVLTATLTLTPTATATAAATPTSLPTNTPVPAACFGALTGIVFNDLNQNGQFDAGEGGLGGAALVLKNASNAIVGVYVTGSGQFSFPGLPAGAYTLSETPPLLFTNSAAPIQPVQIDCNANVVQNVGNFLFGATPVVTPTAQPTLVPTRTPTPSPRAQADQSPAPPTAPAGGGGQAGGGGAINPSGGVAYLASCGSLNSSGTYYLTTSLVSQWDCLQLFSDNIVLDCQGNSLNGVDFNGYGIVVHKIGFPISRPPQNIEIRNCRSSTHKYGIYVDAAVNLYLHHNTITSNFTDVDARRFGVFLGLPEGGGIRANDLGGARITDNVSNGNAIGIDIRNSNNVVVSRNTTSDNTAWGVHFYNVHSSEVSFNTAADNVRYCTWGNGTVGPGCDAGGIMLQGGSNFVTVKNNQLLPGNGNGIFIKAHDQPCGNDNTIAFNRITGYIYNGIEASFCQSNHILGNEIDHGIDGVWLGFSLHTQVQQGNSIHDTNNHGLISWNSAENTVSDNTIANAREGIYLYSSGYNKNDFYFVPGSPADHIAQGNFFGNNNLSANAVAAFHFSNAVRNEVRGNTLRSNGRNFMFDGNTTGNVIENNTIFGGAELLDVRHLAAPLRPPWSAPMYSAQLPGGLRSLAPAWDDSPDLAWFKSKLRLSFLGQP